MTIQAAPLPNPAFFGKNVVIPVTVTANPGPIDTNGLTIAMVYQLIGADGVTPLGAPLKVSCRVYSPDRHPAGAYGNRNCGYTLV